MKKLFIFCICNTILTCTFSQNPTSDDLLRIIKCRNHECLKEYIKEKELDFVFDINNDSVDTYLPALEFKYKSREQIPFTTNEGVKLQATDIVTFKESLKTDGWIKIDYLVHSTDLFTTLINGFEKKGFKITNTDEASTEKTNTTYKSTSSPDLTLTIIKKKKTFDDGSYILYTISLASN